MSDPELLQGWHAESGLLLYLTTHDLERVHLVRGCAASPPAIKIRLIELGRSGRRSRASITCWPLDLVTKEFPSTMKQQGLA
jgi:hypothetical protein